MEMSSSNERLKKYELGNDVIYVGFASYEDAENYAREHNGELKEIGFTDGNDNPFFTNDGHLIENKQHYAVHAGAEYKFIHSSDSGFREYADELQKVKSDLKGYSPEEKIMANGETEITEDPIIVLKNDQFESVTSRERSKYLKQANVYEIGVIVSK